MASGPYANQALGAQQAQRNDYAQEIRKQGIEDETQHLERSIAACVSVVDELEKQLSSFLLPPGNSVATSDHVPQAVPQQRSTHADHLRSFVERIDALRMRMSDLCARVEV